MSFFSQIIGKAGSMFPRVVQASLPSGVLEMLKRYGKMPDVSQEALVRKYWGWTYMCAQVSAQRFASTPLKLYASRAKGQSYVKNFSAHRVDKQHATWLRKRVGKSLPQVAGAEDFEELEEHPLLDLLQNVNDQENSYEMKLLTSTMLDLTGDSYWMTERDKMGVPSRLFVLRSQWVKIVPDKEKFIGEYIYGVNQFGQESVHIAPENVIHFKYPNPLDPWYGMGPVQSAAYAMESAGLREKFILATMGNMARPDIIVKYLEGELDPKERGLLEREWNAMFRGPKNAGKVKVTDFRYEIDKVGWTPQELRFNEGEDWIMKKICGAFPVPIGLVDTAQISRAPRAGMEGADLFMAQFNTLPRCTLVEEKLNEQLCPMYDGERLFLAFDNPVPKDKREQLNEDSVKLNTCVITVNEVRQRDGDEPVPWGDTPIPLQQSQAAAQQFAPLGSQPQPSATGGDAANPANINAKAPAPDGGGSSGGASTEDKKTEEKGGPGSGSWEGPGDPRFARDGALAPNSTYNKLKVGEVVVLPGHSKTPYTVTALRKHPNGDIELHLSGADGDIVSTREADRPVHSAGAPANGYYKSLLDGSMSMEVDGQYVSPSLAGIPVRLRVRNEGGRFDRRGVGRLRGSREAIESLKGKADDEDGKWVTMNGQPVFIREGQSAEDAAKERFGGGKRDIVREDLDRRTRERLALEERMRNEPRPTQDKKPDKQPERTSNDKPPVSGTGKTKADPIVISEKPPKHLQPAFEQETRPTASRGFAYNDRVSLMSKDAEGKWRISSGYLHEMDEGKGAIVSTNHGWFRVPKESLRFPKGYRRASEG
jgi:HK97 family phage portal protein